MKKEENTRDNKRGKHSKQEVSKKNHTKNLGNDKNVNKNEKNNKQNNKNGKKTKKKMSTGKKVSYNIIILLILIGWFAFKTIKMVVDLEEC